MSAGPQAAERGGEEQNVFVAFFHAQGALGVTALAGERRIFQNHVELHFIPFVFAAANGIAPHEG